MYQFEVNTALLLTIVAGALALFFQYFPGVSSWFDGLSAESKQLLNLGLVVLTAVVLFVGDCYGLFDTNLVCDTKGALDLLVMVFYGMTINQGVYKGVKYIGKPAPAQA